MASKTPARTGPQRPNDRSRRARTANRAIARRRWQVGATVVSSVAVLAVVAALAFTGGGGHSTVGFSASQTAFDLPALTGNGHVRLAAYRGRPVVVNFFASWCVFCNEELPGYVQVAKASQGRVAFVGVDTDDPGDGAAMADRFGLAQAGIALARDIGPAPASELWSSYGVQGLPVTAFYSATGKLVDVSNGMLTQAQLEARLTADFGIDVQAVDAANLAAPVIPVIPMGAYELMRSHQQDPTFQVLDVRAAAAYAAGHVPGATSLVSDSADASARLGGLDRNQTYLVYSQTGRRGAQATTLMHRMGFKHVYVIQGGLAAWQQAGLPTQPGSGG
ncbi:MAG: rhodanese-like domain-containing protein [Actinomycetes bacterium]